MKRLRLLIGLALMAVGAVWLTHASPIVVSGSPQNVTGSYGSPAYGTSVVALAFSALPTLQQYTIQHGALNNTNDLVVVFSSNVTSNIVNAVKVYTWHPTTTNAATEIIYAGTTSITNYTFATISSTNSQDFYIQYGQ